MNKTNKILALAPMAGFTDSAFRLLCGKFGANELVTEMVSARALYYKDKKTHRIMEVDPDEKNVIIQIFGWEPDILKAVVEKVINPREDYIGIDLNMGCPVSKTIKSGDGCDLMRNPERAELAVETLVKASNKPVSVKFRLGWDLNNLNYLDFGKRMENAGATKITLHGRTKSQYYSGEADWNPIKELAKELNIPVIGNGDIIDEKIAIKRFEETDIAGIAIGRGAIGKPWIFRQIKDVLEGKEIFEPDFKEIIDIAIYHLNLAVEKKGERIAIPQMRKHLLDYLKGFYGAKEMRRRLLEEESLIGLENILRSFI